MNGVAGPRTPVVRTLDNLMVCSLSIFFSSVLSNAEAIRSFYSDHYSHQRDRNFTCLGSVWKQVLGDCLANSHGRNEVKRCRGPFEKYFTSNYVTGFLPVIGRECKKFLKTLPTNTPVDLMKQGLSNVTLRVLVQTVYGEEVLTKYFDRIVQISHQLTDTVDLFTLLETKLPFYSMLPTKTNQQAQLFNKTWSDFNQFLFREYEEGRLKDDDDALFFVMMAQMRNHALDLREREVCLCVEEEVLFALVNMHFV